jgi:hypothetical protein
MQDQITMDRATSAAQFKELQQMLLALTVNKASQAQVDNDNASMAGSMASLSSSRSDHRQAAPSYIPKCLVSAWESRLQSSPEDLAKLVTNVPANIQKLRHAAQTSNAVLDRQKLGWGTKPGEAADVTRWLTFISFMRKEAARLHLTYAFATVGDQVPEPGSSALTSWVGYPEDQRLMAMQTFEQVLLTPQGIVQANQDLGLLAHIVLANCFLDRGSQLSMVLSSIESSDQTEGKLYTIIDRLQKNFMPTKEQKEEVCNTFIQNMYHNMSVPIPLSKFGTSAQVYVETVKKELQDFALLGSHQQPSEPLLISKFGNACAKSPVAWIKSFGESHQRKQSQAETRSYALIPLLDKLVATEEAIPRNPCDSSAAHAAAAQLANAAAATAAAAQAAGGGWEQQRRDRGNHHLGRLGQRGAEQRPPNVPPPPPAPSEQHAIPKAGYTCKKCNLAGHFLENCPKSTPAEREHDRKIAATRFAEKKAKWAAMAAEREKAGAADGASTQAPGNSRRRGHQALATRRLQGMPLDGYEDDDVHADLLPSCYRGTSAAVQRIVVPAAEPCKYNNLALASRKGKKNGRQPPPRAQRGARERSSSSQEEETPAAAPPAK